MRNPQVFMKKIFPNSPFIIILSSELWSLSTVLSLHWCISFFLTMKLVFIHWCISDPTYFITGAFSSGRVSWNYTEKIHSSWLPGRPSRTTFDPGKWNKNYNRFLLSKALRFQEARSLENCKGRMKQLEKKFQIQRTEQPSWPDR